MIKVVSEVHASDPPHNSARASAGLISCNCRKAQWSVPTSYGGEASPEICSRGVSLSHQGAPDPPQ